MSIKNTPHFGEVGDLRGLPFVVPASHTLNNSDSSSMTYVLPHSVASMALRLMALLRVVRSTPLSLANCAIVFILATRLRHNGIPGSEADRSANRGFASIDLIAGYTSLADFKYRGASLIRPGTVPGANRNNQTVCNLAVDLCYCHCHFSSFHFAYLIFGTFLLYSTYVEKSRGFDTSLTTFQNIRKNSQATLVDVESEAAV